MTYLIRIPHIKQIKVILFRFTQIHKKIENLAKIILKNKIKKLKNKMLKKALSFWQKKYIKINKNLIL
jgi:hypothetical protein